MLGTKKSKSKTYKPGKVYDLRYSKFPDGETRPGSSGFDYTWWCATQIKPLIPNAVKGAIRPDTPLPNGDKPSPIPLSPSLRKQCFSDFDEINLKKFGVPDDEVFARLSVRMEPGIYCAYPLPNKDLQVRPTASHLRAVNFPRRVPGLPVSTHSKVREMFHGILPDTGREYGFSMDEAMFRLFAGAKTFTRQQYNGKRFFRRLVTDNLHGMDMSYVDRELIFKELLRDREYYGLRPWQLLHVAPPVYITAIIEEQPFTFHPWLLFYSAIARAAYLSAEFDAEINLPGTRKAWFTFARTASAAVLDPTVVVPDVEIIVPKKPVERAVVPRKPGYEEIGKLSPARKWALSYAGFQVILDADGCADLLRFIVKFQITVPMTIYWFTSSLHTTLTHVTVADLELLRRHRVIVRLTPAGPDVADDHIVEATSAATYIDVVITRDYGLMNRVIDLGRPDLLLVGPPETVAEQILNFDQFSGIPTPHRPKSGERTFLE